MIDPPSAPDPAPVAGPGAAVSWSAVSSAGTTPAGIDPDTASAEIDLAAYRRNLGRLAAVAAPAALMAVVKADGYGHGLVPLARAARSAGVAWLGVATAGEAMALRAAGDSGPLLCWLYGPSTDLGPVLAAGVDLGVSGPEELARIVTTAETLRETGRAVTARVHLKIDTGLSRNGCPPDRWPELCRRTAEAVSGGTVVCAAVWTHLACADEPGHPATPRQLTRFADADRVARDAGLRPGLRHVANSAGALLLPETRHQLVRVGIAGYGLDPAPGIAALAGVELEPVMTLRARLVQVKPLAAGEGVSYGMTWTAARDTVVGLVPLGYADGIPRIAGNAASVVVSGREVPIVGRVCMDQFVVDLGADAADRMGDEVVVFGAGGRGADDLAAACGTIGYEIVTRVGARVPRRYAGDPAPASEEEHGRSSDA